MNATFRRSIITERRRAALARALQKLHLNHNGHHHNGHHGACPGCRLERAMVRQLWNARRDVHAEMRAAMSYLRSLSALDLQWGGSSSDRSG